MEPLPGNVIRVIDQQVEKWLGQTQWQAPAVNAIELARRLGLIISWDQQLTGRGRCQRLGEQSVIFIRPDPRPERVQWTVAHELGELAAPLCFPHLKGVLDEQEPAQREQFANAFASRLLLPTKWISQDLQDGHDDLMWFKDRYSTASCELIISRWLDFQPSAVLTIFDEQQMTRRRSGWARRPPRLQQMEQACVEQVRSTAAPYCCEDEQLRVRGWPVYEPGWQREILWTRPLEEACCE